ncbi:MAG: glycosyltransferase family 2 protein [Geitlerinemataceae cyanobacterium]|mgnify:CR=1 FL=1
MSREKLEFSVVITTYNRLDLLPIAIESALEQTLAPKEVIVVDDCSTRDETEAYMRELSARDPRVKYIRNGTNLHHSRSVNKGVEAATGNWIKFLDDDDYLAPTCLEVMADGIAAAQAKTSDEIAMCSVQAYQEYLDGKIFHCTKLPVPVAGVSLSFGTEDAGYLVPQDDVHYNMLTERLPFGTPVQVACSKKAFEAAGGWNHAFSGSCDDIEFWIRAASEGAAVMLHAPVAHRTHGDDNISDKLTPLERCQTNTTIKHKIYERISLKYAKSLPPMERIQGELEVHWTLVSLKRCLKQKKIDDAKDLLARVASAPSHCRSYLSSRLKRA